MISGASRPGEALSRSLPLALALATLVGLTVAAAPRSAHGAGEDEERFLSIDQAPGAVFPEADAFERRDVAATPELRAQIARRLGSVRPSLWEDTYVVFTARRGGEALGFAVVIEEIGKHRPITSIVGVRPDGKVKDVAVMVYREAYGGEVRQRRFLDQYPGHEAGERFAGRIRNVAGATLSVEALNRTVQKGLAVVDVLELHPDAPTPAPSVAP